MSAALRGHERNDQRSLALHRAIAEKLRSNPALMEIARDNLERWSTAVRHSQPYWDAWREVLRLPFSEILEVMLEEGERMTAMRQASPFAGVLTPQERWGVYEEFARENP